MAPPGSEDAPSATGVAIDDAERPGWLTAHLSERQLGLEIGLQWMTALEMAPGYGPTERAVASSLFRKTIGKRIKKAWPTVRQLLSLAGVGSQNTVVKALKRLVGDGWLRREVRAAQSRRLAPERPGQAGVGYRLAWPVRDCIGAPLDGGPERCGRPTTKGALCTVRAGKGTTHRGTGPCWKHGGDRAAKEADQAAAGDFRPGGAPAAEPPQAPARPAPTSTDEASGSRSGGAMDDRPSLHLLKHSGNAPPVDKPGIQLPLLQPVQGGMLQRLQLNAATGEAGMPQPLRRNAATGGAEVVSKKLDQGAIQESDGSDVLGAELEDSPNRSSDGTFEAAPVEDSAGLSIERAHALLDELTEHMLTFYLSRAAMDLRKAGRPEPEPDELVLATAAAIARRRSA